MTDDYPDPEDLLPFYERELALLRRSMREFSERFPHVAARLGIVGDRTEDPHVERLMQSAALLNAKAAAKIDDGYPEIPTAMLERLYPEVLRPFPSSSIAQIRAVPDPSLGPRTIARGTQFVSHRGKYRFRSAYDVALTSLRVAQVTYAPVAVAPRGVTLPESTFGLLSITFAVSAKDAGFASVPDRVRIYLDGSRPTVAALADTFLLRAIEAFVDIDDHGQWRALEASPFAGVGFEEADSVFGVGKERAFPLRLLLEYFAFPERFNFIEVDFAKLRKYIQAGTHRGVRIAVHLAIGGVGHSSRIAQHLSSLTADNLRLCCTPVANLFERDIELVDPISIPGYAAPRYPVVPRGVSVADTEVWSVDQVSVNGGGAGRETIEPLHAFGYRRYYGAPVWELMRNERAVREKLGSEAAIIVRNLDGEPVPVDSKQLSMKITCTNRNLPSGMSIGVPEGDLEAMDAEPKCPVVLLRMPTESRWPKVGADHWWQLLSQLTPHTCSLDQVGWGGLKALLQAFAVRSGAEAWQLEGVISLRQRDVMLWTSAAGVAGFERGIEVTIVLDEQHFESDSMSAFISVMDRLLAAYVHTNNPTQLIAVSAATGAVIRQCAPRRGCLPII